MHECEKCGDKSFSSNHINNYATNPVKCNECDTSFCTKLLLKKHEKSTHKKIKVADAILIYKITSPEGKSFIGKTTNLEKKILHHKRNSLSPVYNVFREHKSNVSVNILYEIKIQGDEMGLFELSVNKELEYITRYDTVKNGYNTIYDFN